MPTTVQFRRGTTAQNNAFTGAVGEITVDTDKQTLIVHDGTTAGGHTLVNDEDTNLWSDITNADVDSAVENVDTFGTSTFRSAHYHYVIENDDASEYQTGQIHVIHDGSNAQITEFGVLRTGNNDLITFTVDVDSGLCRLRASAQTPNSKFKAKRVSLEVQ